MSNHVTNLEIEDVLSSIRRLVAEGDKLRSILPKAEPQGTQIADPFSLRDADRLVSTDVAQVIPESDVEVDPPRDATSQAPKLLLTPALRVAEPRTSTVLLWEEAGDDPVPSVRADHETTQITDNAGDGAANLDDVIREAGAETLVLRSADLMNAAPALDPDPVEEIEATTPAPVNGGRSRLEATIAELEAAITSKPDEWEPDGSEVTPVMDWAAGSAEPAFLSSRQGSHRLVVEEAEELPDWPPSVAAADLRGEREDHLEDFRQDLSGEDAGHLADDLEVGPTLSDTRPAGLDLVSPALSDDQILDEEALRNLVVEIVRQELQGALGERITRNVRKLVRREIYRVLSSQEFD